MAKEYKVKTLKNGEKRYIFDVNLGYRADGTRVRTTINAKSVKEGRKKVAELTLGKKVVVENNSLTFKQAWNMYIKDCQNRKLNTYPKEMNYNKYYARFDNIKINKITEHDLKIFIDNLDKRLKQNTKHNIAKDLKSFFNWARKNKLININPFDYIDIPKNQKVDMNYWTEDEFKRFIKSVKNQYWKKIFTTLFYTGLRKGELFGLSYEDIHGNELHLSHSIKINRGKQVLSSSFKTESSKRIVPLPKWLDLGQGEGLIFKKGYKTAGTVLKREIKKYNDTHKDSLKYIRIHDFRHSYISMLIFKKVDIFTVSKVAGHTNIKTTTQTYGHLYDETRNEISNIL